MALFVETGGRIGGFTVVPQEIFEDPITKRKTKKPGIRLTTVWSGRSPGFLSTDHLPPGIARIAESIWGKDWAKTLDEAIVKIGKANGLVMVEKTKESLELFAKTQSPDFGLTGTRSLGDRKKGKVAPVVVVNLTPVVQAPVAHKSKVG